MKIARSIQLLFFVAIMLPGCQSNDNQDKKNEGGDNKKNDVRDDYASADGRFRVYFPDSPKIQDSKSPAGIRFKKAMVEEKSGVFFVMYADLDIPAKESSEKTQARLKDVESDMRIRLGATINKSKYTAEPVPTQEFEGSMTKPRRGAFRTKIVLSDRRMYHVEVMGEESLVNSDRATKFLETFRLTK